MLKYFLIFIVASSYTSGTSTTKNDSYTAAVVEFEYTTNVKQNVENYVNLIHRAAVDYCADIIVFPELTLMGRLQSVRVPFDCNGNGTMIPANNPKDFDEIIVKLSKAARDNKIYVVLNVNEKADCTKDKSVPCVGGKTIHMFNTNVVFDRNGAIIDRYRKVNLYADEIYYFTPGTVGDFGMFKTDFGVTFGHFICFDMFFRHPTLDVIDKHNITNIAYPTMNVAFSPFLIGANMQIAISYVLDINLLAAGANNVTDGAAGSGIYSGKSGPLISVQPLSSETYLLVSRVPKIPGQIEPREDWLVKSQGPIEDLLTIVSYPDLFISKDRELVPGRNTIDLSGGGVTCSVDVTLHGLDASAFYYRAFLTDFAVNGTQILFGCGITACLNESLSSCMVFSNETINNEGPKVKVSNLEVILNGPTPQYDAEKKSRDILYAPVTLKNDKYFLDFSDYSYTETSNGPNTTLACKLESPVTDLFSFSALGRRY